MDLKQSYMHQAVLAEFHRWYLGYECHPYSMTNQHDILDQNISPKSELGTTTGRAAVVDPVKQPPLDGKTPIAFEAEMAF